ncbi:MAG: di-trans,poly-cis-decaprenylcistransferase [Spirochaetales bacterium]|jgi:undecaprenyl diphosphate synthase|nr:di-trans,poly-cis-decaprenylcistransferase [Spirochaetales bacterium]
MVHESNDGIPVNPEKLPVHVGIIMDGNGRWARARNQNRSEGHREGLQASKRVVRAAAEIGIPYLSLYTFSTENWKRTQEEVSFLMGLVHQHLRKEYEFYKENGIRLRYAGDMDGLSKTVREDILLAIDDTKNFRRLTVNLALNYGGRDEIVRAVRRWMLARGEDDTPAALTEEALSSNMDNPDIPDPDLIIRSAGETRISNFLIWEGAYAEYYFSEKLWPDWDSGDLYAALAEYQNRVRKYGGVV